MATPLHSPCVLLMDIFAGHAMIGPCVSDTVTVKAQVAVFPAPSVTRKPLVVEPTGNMLPDNKPDVCVVFGLEQLSVPTGAI